MDFIKEEQSAVTALLSLNIYDINISYYLEEYLDKDEPLSTITLIGKDYFLSNIESKYLSEIILIYNHCLKNNIKKVEEFIKKYKIINDIFGNNLLFYAVANQFYEMTILLINNGFDINQKDTFGRTVLHIACREGNSSMVSLLLNYGADQYIKDHLGRVSILVAFTYNNDDIILELLKTFKVYESLNFDNLMILHLATLYGSKEIVNQILKFSYRMVYINDKIKSTGFTALHMCLYNEEIFNIIIQNGASTDIPDNNGMTVKELKKINILIYK